MLERITDFFLGLNAGQWLKIRVAQISDGALSWLKTRADTNDSGCATVRRTITATELLKDTGLRPLLGATEQPPVDSRHLHHFFGNFGAQGDRWAQHELTCDGAQRNWPNQSPSVRSPTDAERMSEALAVVRARRESTITHK